MTMMETVIVFIFLLAVVGPWVWGVVYIVGGVGLFSREKQRGLSQIRVGACVVLLGSLVAEVGYFLTH